MCGIAGYVRWQGGQETETALLQEMTRRIAHRGPDDVGFLVAGNQAKTMAQSIDRAMTEDADLGKAFVGLAHRRLSIIDLSEHGHQPMCSEIGTWISYNGEIYNFRELRAELVAKGIRFRTETDTEVLLAAYDFWGIDFVSRCKGMFALAIFIPKKRRVLLYRDRVGIKPLYVYEDERGVSFCSELKGLLADQSIKRRVDPAAVRAYLEFQVVHHRPETFLQAIREVPAGHFVDIDLDKGQTTLHRYYHLGEAVERRKEDLPNARSELVPFIRQKFTDTLREHFVSDVRVGSCLSGGLDSSSIVCTADRLLASNDTRSDSLGKRIITFSSCNEDAKFDEQEYIDTVVASCSADPIKIFPSPDDLADRFDDLVWHQDEPFTSPSIFAQFLLMEAARAQNVTVLLDGQGGDEIFAGYRKFFFFYMQDLLKKGHAATFAKEMYGGLTKGDGDLFDFRAMRRYLPSALKNQTITISSFLRRGAFDELELDGFQSGASIIDRQVLDIERYSVPALLRYEDRNSMAFGIEARVPFLDHEFMECAIALPIEAKISGGISKDIMRKAMKGIVPDAVVNRRTKMGFATPELDWMANALRPQFEATLAAPHEAMRSLVDMAEITKQYRLFLDGSKSALAPREFFRLLCLNRWMQKFSVSVA